MVDDGGPRPKFVLEVGIFELYKELVEDVKLGLDGHPDVICVVLAKLTETPKHRCPLVSPDPAKLAAFWPSCLRTSDPLKTLLSTWGDTDPSLIRV